MTNRPNLHQDISVEASHHDSSNPIGAAETRIERIAELVASGQLPFTAITDHPDRALVLERVGRKLRHDLIRTIAIAIARDVYHSQQDFME